jgi:hypothetical protein
MKLKASIHIFIGIIAITAPSVYAFCGYLIDAADDCCANESECSQYKHVVGRTCCVGPGLKECTEPSKLMTALYVNFGACTSNHTCCISSSKACGGGVFWNDAPVNLPSGVLGKDCS